MLTTRINTQIGINQVYIPVALSVKSVHGSARTCKSATLRILREWFHVYYLPKYGNRLDGKFLNDGRSCTTTNNSTDDSLLRELHSCMEEVCSLE